MDNPIENLVNELNRLPGIGDKTARRLAYYIINMDPNRVNGLVNAISNAIFAIILLILILVKFALVV